MKGQEPVSPLQGSTYLPLISEISPFWLGGIQRTSPGTPSVSSSGYEKFFQSTSRTDCGAAKLADATMSRAQIWSKRFILLQSVPHLELQPANCWPKQADALIQCALCVASRSVPLDADASKKDPQLTTNPRSTHSLRVGSSPGGWPVNSEAAPRPAEGWAGAGRGSHYSVAGAARSTRTCSGASTSDAKTRAFSFRVSIAGLPFSCAEKPNSY